MNKIYDDFFHDSMIINPDWNLYFQIPKYKKYQKVFKNYISPKEIKKQKDFYKKYKKLLDKRIKSKSYKNYPDKIKLYDKILNYEINTSLEGFKYNFEYMPLDQMENSIVSYMIEASGEAGSLYQFETVGDYKDYIIRTTQFSDFCNQCIKNMKKGIKKGIVLPRKITIKLTSDIEDALNSNTHYNKKVPPKLRKEWDKTMEKHIVKPVKKLITFLKGDYLKASRKTIGLYDVPNGDKMYDYAIKVNTTLDNLSAKDIHEIGKKEVSRIEKEMNKIKNKHGFKNKSLKQFNEYLNKLPEQHFKNKKDLMNTYKDMQKYIWKNVMPQNFDIPIKYDYLIKPVPKSMELSAAQAYYEAGDLSGKRKGIFYINQRDVPGMLRMDVESLSLHEGNPGHHYQTTITNESDIPMFIKMGNYVAYIEGWALYSENLGVYEDDISYYGKLSSEMFRSVRLVVDTGIHRFKWSYDKCKKYFKKYTPMSDIDIDAELDRYISLLGQALSYKIGELTILKLKHKYKNMNIKKFHRKVLENGNIPLKILEEYFKKY